MTPTPNAPAVVSGGGDQGSSRSQPVSALLGADCEAARSCTCHPTEAPVPCERLYAMGDCAAASDARREALTRLIYRELPGMFSFSPEANLLDAIATFRGDEDVGAAQTMIGDASAWLADAILAFTDGALGRQDGPVSTPGMNNPYSPLGKAPQ